MPTPPNGTPGNGRPARASRLGLVTASFAAAGSFAVAFVGLGGPPADPAPAPSATAVAADPSGSTAPVTTIYIHLPAPTATPIPTSAAATPGAQTSVVTRQSGLGAEADAGGEQEGND